MSLSVGQKLGPYQITAAIGAGGMGEVYRARDTRLDRTVAIKISAEQFSERFEREARAVASINHPSICTLYDVGPNFLVMEYIDGPTLAERIAAGPLPLPEALEIARQIADALEAAHDKGIVHRDLKPANVKLTAEGKVKVLDFGLAKAFESTAGSGDPANSPTLSMASTRAGVILGTAAYMSPEQARGKPVDRRADIWAFGVVLFEMLTGRQVFGGETVSDTLAAVLRADLDFSALPADTPPAIRRLLRRSLERDPQRRLRDIADARLEIEERETVAMPAAVPHRGKALPWALAALFLIATAVLAARLWRGQPDETSYELSLLAPDKSSPAPVGAQTGGLALSPDGRTLAYSASQGGRSMLWVRRLDSSAARALPGTENGYYPFWSPDSRFLGFFTNSKLMKIEVAGGPPQVVCNAAVARGGAWNRDGVILFSGIDRALHRVDAGGGQPAAVTKLDTGIQDNAHYWPHFLPDGRHFLYMARSSDREKSGICVGTLDSGPGPQQRSLILRNVSNPAFTEGHLLFVRDGTLFAQRFDPSRLKLAGDAQPVAEQVGYAANVGLANYTVSANGVLAYGGNVGESNVLAWATRDGRLSPVAVEPSAYEYPRLSPDGTRLAVARADLHAGTTDIWIIDLARATSTRFTFGPGLSLFPVWSPDGTQIAFSGVRESSVPKLYVKPSNGTGVEQRLEPNTSRVELSSDWSADGRYLLFVEAGGPTDSDLYTVSMADNWKVAPFLQSPFSETEGQFSPDGNWVAYVSNESGRDEVYVRNFGGTPAKYQVSEGGASQPRWRGDGKEMYYVSTESTLMAVDVTEEAGSFVRGTARELFAESSLRSAIPNAFTYDVTRDGKRFLLIKQAQAPAAQPLTVVVNWPARLKR